MPKWKDLKRFCEKDGWELYKDTYQIRLCKLFGLEEIDVHILVILHKYF